MPPLAEFNLAPPLWHRGPAYSHNGKVLCFFRTAEKDGARYTSLGFSDKADLDEGILWPTSYALADVDEKAAQQITKLVLDVQSRPVSSASPNRRCTKAFTGRAVVVAAVL